MENRPHGRRFVVRYGVALPPIGKPKPKSKKSKYPFARMRVGGSFGFPKGMKVALVSALRDMKKRDQKMRKRKFTFRAYKRDYRVWRLK